MSGSSNRNWICLTHNVKTKSDSEKKQHILYLLKRKNEIPSVKNTKPQFLQLIHCIRTLCIIKAYFPYNNDYDFDIDNHPGWDDFMTPQERILLNDFKCALEEIKKNRNTRKFDIVDRKFGDYRYNKWIETQK